MSNFSPFVISTTVPAVLRWIYTRSAAGRAIVGHDSIVFPGSKVVPIIHWGGLLFFSVLAFASWTYDRSLLATLISAGFATLAIFARVDPIVINRDGISGASTWGRRAALAWNDVAALEFNTGNKNTW